MNAFSIFAVISLAAYLIIGVYVSRRLKNVDDYYVMGRKAPALLIVGTLIASNLSSVTLIAYTGGIFRNGPGLYMLIWPSTWILLILGFWLGKYIMPLKLWTLPDYFAGRFPSNRVRMLATIIVVLSVTLYLVSVMMGTASATAGLLEWSFETSLISCLVVVALFTIVGGMWGVVVTDTIMFVLFFAGALLLSPFVISAAGGWPDAFKIAAEKLPQMLTWNGKMPEWAALNFLLQVCIGSIVLGLAAPHILSRVFLTDNPRTLARAMVASAVLYPVFIVGFLFVIGLSPLFAPADLKPVDIYPWISRNIVPTVIGALALSGVIAAALSTASSLLQQAGAALSRDVYQRLINPDVSDRQLLLISRVTVAIVAAFVYASVIFRDVASTAIINAFLFASSFWAAWLPALVGGLITKKTTEAGAFWGMATGTTLALISGVLQVLKMKPDWMPAPIIIAIVSSIAVTWIVSALTSPKKGEAEFFDSSRLQANFNANFNDLNKGERNVRSFWRMDHRHFTGPVDRCTNPDLAAWIGANGAYCCISVCNPPPRWLALYSFQRPLDKGQITSPAAAIETLRPLVFASAFGPLEGKCVEAGFDYWRFFGRQFGRAAASGWRCLD